MIAPRRHSPTASLAAALFVAALLGGCGNPFTGSGSSSPSSASSSAESGTDETGSTESPSSETPSTETPSAEGFPTEAPSTDGFPTEEPSTEAPSTEGSSTGLVDRVVDGDTIVVDGQKIRVIGIDTPERGECGYDSATQAMAALVQGRIVTLTPGARDDADKYDRLLRYVDVEGVDAGLSLIRDGWAIARYDSRDGYGAHTREAEYVAADAASEPRCDTEYQP